jgi:dihydroorotase/N-acyl-D-amino-acid deacylase
MSPDRTGWGVLAVLAVAGAAWMCAPAPAAQSARYDLLIRHARLVDGTGAPWYAGDLAVSADRIVAVGHVPPGVAQVTLDAAGQVVSPGFIDLHTHARRGIFEVPTAENYLRQGVTTIFEGPDGSSPLPIGEFLDRVAATPITPNFGTFVGHGTVRARVLGEADRAPGPDELEAMRGLVREAMRQGAFGISTGLFYVPGAFARPDEVIALAREVAPFGGLHISHMRDEASRVVDSVRETIAIGEGGGVPTQVTHHKIIGAANRGRSAETLRLVDEARERGVDATIDQYPYTASSTSIQAALIPPWAQEGGRAALLARLRDTATRARVRAEAARLVREERGGGDPRNIVIARCEWDPALDGKSFADVLRERDQAPTPEHAADLAMSIVERGGCQGIFHAIDEGDLVAILRHPATMIASDGEVVVFGRAHPHPRSYGTFARVLAVYVREQAVLRLEDAVRRMTSMPAWRVGLHDRGLLRPGMKADLAVWDPAAIADRATFDRPHQYATGVSLVVVNGQVVFDGKAMTDARPGQVLRKRRG